MDGQAIAPSALRGLLGTAAAPVVIDVRRAPAFDGDEFMIASAIRRLPEHVASWAAALPPGRNVVVYCVHGHEVSQGVAHLRILWDQIASAARGCRQGASRRTIERLARMPREAVRVRLRNCSRRPLIGRSVATAPVMYSTPPPASRT